MLERGSIPSYVYLHKWKWEAEIYEFRCLEKNKIKIISNQLDREIWVTYYHSKKTDYVKEKN